MTKQLLLGLLALAFAAPAFADDSAAASGLGQAHPAAPDVSASPDWAVYTFQSGDTRFVQINDPAGNVRGAFAYANGHALVLPMGDPARVVVEDGGAAAAGAAAGSQLVYRNDAVQVTAVPQDDGVVLMVAPDCHGDPVECSTH
jgi:hypothetical protein